MLLARPEVRMTTSDQPENAPLPPSPTERVVVIGGAAGALAGATAEVFAANGWKLVLLARRPHIDDLARRFPGADVVAVDLTAQQDVASAAAGILERHGRVDALLNLTGGFAMAEAASVSEPDLDSMLERNLYTAFHMTRALIPAMVERGEGFVLGVSARAALHGGRRTTAYGAAKGAVTGYFRNLRAELAPHGVGVSLLFPMGTIDTPANREAMPDADPAGFIDLARLAEAIHFLAGRTPRDRIAELQVSAD